LITEIILPETKCKPSVVVLEMFRYIRLYNTVIRCVTRIVEESVCCGTLYFLILFLAGIQYSKRRGKLMRSTHRISQENTNSTNKRG
jgi:hypothetical protein